MTTGQQRPGFPEPTIAFHFSPQFGANAVVRNTYQVPAGWGPEERSGVLPFIRGANFQVQITAEPYEFKVSFMMICCVTGAYFSSSFHHIFTLIQVLVNGVFFCSYKYRIPINQIRALGVTGEVKIHQIHCQSGQVGRSEAKQMSYINRTSKSPFYTVIWELVGSL